MKTKNYILTAIFLAAAFSYQVVFGAFYPVNRGMVNTSTGYTNNWASNVTLVQASNQVHLFSGSDNQIVVLPNAQNLPDDWWYEFVNNSSGWVTVRNDGGSNIASVNAGRIGKFFLTDISTTNGTWIVNSPAAPVDLDHGGLTGLGDDDHLQYHNDTRGDARYFREDEFIDESTGVADAGKPVKTNASGLLDISMSPGAASTSTWVLDGNAGTDPLTQYLGTSDGQDLVFRTNATEALRINTSQELDTLLAAGVVKANASGILLSTTVDLATDVSGTLPVASGGTGEQSVLAAFDALSPLTTKGDLVTNDGTNDIRFPVCGDDELISGQASQPSGWLCLAKSYLGTSDHGGLSGLLDDDHTQYALLDGRATGQILTGGTASGDDLTLRSTSDATKGSVIIDETTVSTSSTTGAAIIGGGIGVAGSAQVAGIVKSETGLELEDPEAGTGVVHISAGTGNVGYILRLPVEAPASGEILKATNSAGNLSWVADAGGVSGIGTLDSQAKAADGAVISGSDIVLQTADASNPGLVSTAAQEFAGVKTLNASPLVKLGIDLEDPSAGTGLVHLSAATGSAGYILRFPLEAPSTGKLLQATGNTGALSWVDSTPATQALTTCTTARTVDWSAGNDFTLTLTSGNACTLTFSNASSGQNITIELTNGSAGGTATVVWPSLRWEGGTAPTMTVGTAALDICTIKYNGSAYSGSCIQNMSVP